MVGEEARARHEGGELGVVAHAPDRFFAALHHGQHKVGQVVGGRPSRDLQALEAPVVRPRRARGGDAGDHDVPLGQRLPIVVQGHQFGLDLFVVVAAAGEPVQRHDLAGTQLVRVDHVVVAVRRDALL